MVDAVHGIPPDALSSTAAAPIFSPPSLPQPSAAAAATPPNAPATLPNQLQCNHACPYHCAAFHANMNNAYMPPPPGSMYYPAPPYYSSNAPSDFPYSYSAMQRNNNNQSQTNNPSTNSHTALHSRTKRRGHGVVSIGDMLDRLQLFFQARLRNFSKNRACAEIEISKGTVNTYQERVNEANKYGINLEEFRDYKRDFKQVFRTTVLQSGEFSSLKKNSSGDAASAASGPSGVAPNAQGSNAGSNAAANDSNSALTSESLLDIDIPPSIANKELIHKIMPKLKLALEPVRILNSEDGHASAQHAQVSSTVIDGAIHTQITGGFHEPKSSNLKRKRASRRQKGDPQATTTSTSKAQNSNDEEEVDEARGDHAGSNEDMESERSAASGASDAENSGDAEEEEGEAAHIAHIIALQSAANSAATSEVISTTPAKSNSAPITSPTTVNTSINPTPTDIASSLNDLKTATPFQLPAEKSSKRGSSPSTDSKTSRTTRSDSRLASNGPSSVANVTLLRKRSNTNSSDVDGLEVGSVNVPTLVSHAIGTRDGVAAISGSADSIIGHSPLTAAIDPRKKQKLSPMDPHPQAYYPQLAASIVPSPPSFVPISTSIAPAPNPYYSTYAPPPPPSSLPLPPTISPSSMSSLTHPLQQTTVGPPPPFHPPMPTYHNPLVPSTAYPPFAAHHSNSAPSVNHPYYPPLPSTLASSRSAPPTSGGTPPPLPPPPRPPPNVNPYMYGPSPFSNPISSTLPPPPSQSASPLQPHLKQPPPMPAPPGHTQQQGYLPYGGQYVP